MAKPVTQITLGIDVAKNQLVARNWSEPDAVIDLDNESKPIRTWLRSFCGPVRIAIEPTSTYHLACVSATRVRHFQGQM